MTEKRMKYCRCIYQRLAKTPSGQLVFRCESKENTRRKNCNHYNGTEHNCQYCKEGLR